MEKTNTTDHFTDLFRVANLAMLMVWKKEQHHAESSTYRYEELKQKNGLENSPTKYTGMTWSAFRPSDDPCQYHYHIPGNMMAYVALEQMMEIATIFYRDEIWTDFTNNLKNEIQEGIEKYGIIHDEEYGDVYAYETDGLGHHVIMDDANIPSLLSIPYLGYKKYNRDVYENTKRLILSHKNPYFFEGKYAKGIGSPHTPHGFIWPLSLIMQGIVSNSYEEKNIILKFLLNTDGNNFHMHESFNPNYPKSFTRSWFAWADSLFALWILKIYKI